MSWSDFLAAVLPAIRDALIMVIAAAAWVAVAYLRSMRDKFEESKNREALDSAIRTGVRAEMQINPEATDKQLAVAGARWATEKGAPDAVSAFGLTGPDLGRKAMSVIPEERSKIGAEKRPC